MKQIFPRANDQDHAGGWTIDTEFLSTIKDSSEDIPCMEVVEAVLLEAEKLIGATP